MSDRDRVGQHHEPIGPLAPRGFHQAFQITGTACLEDLKLHF
jgi:hypothetical protein